ncbi:MAG: tRNA-dihydrouridine synthase family protein [Phycisphaeraceae bacterium]|nr:tRNA-dihydrouridine synthase family protein [Phycisphaeraceae bacterium]
MVHLGKLALDAPFFQAGLAGYSDAAMRLIARRHGAPYCVTEAMLDQFLLRGGKGLAAARLDERDHPIAGQLMGSHPRDIAAGARVLLQLGYDVIDVNLACPVKKIRKKCRGGHLLSAPDEAIAILDAVKQMVGDDAPCTVKLRRGSDDSAEAEANFYRIFEAAISLGYAGVVVHGRTVKQKYLGPSRWAFLKQLTARYSREAASGFVIGGSGDIETAADIFRMIDETGVQLVSVARGCIGNPWLFTQARALINDRPALPPTIEQQANVLREHFDLSARLHGEIAATRMMRKFGIRFSSHHPEPPMQQQIKDAFIAVQTSGQWRAVLERFYETSQV